MTAAVHRRISKRDLLAALRHAGMPLDTHRNRAYFIGIDSRGREFEIILAADDRDRLLARKPRTSVRGEPIPCVAGRSPAFTVVGLVRGCVA